MNMAHDDPDARRDELRCSFCGHSRESRRKLIAGPLVFICDECVQVCVDIIKDDETFAASAGSASEPRPVQHPPPMPGLMDHLAELSVPDQWLLVMHLLARLRDRQLTPEEGLTGRNRTKL
jgi:hypothetical protein